MYSIEDIKQLISAVDKSDVTALELKGEKGDKVIIKKEVQAVTVAPPPQTVTTTVSSETAVVQTPDMTAPCVQESGTAVKSPMVGVFYSAPSPDSEPFVTVGSAVKKGDVICIIEAMKLMNEITAEQDGIIKEICAQNGDIIEYGQKLFIIE